MKPNLSFATPGGRASIDSEWVYGGPCSVVRHCERSAAIQRISMGVMFNKFVLRLITIAGKEDKGKDITSVENGAQVSSSRSEVSFYSDR